MLASELVLSVSQSIVPIAVCSLAAFLEHTVVSRCSSVDAQASILVALESLLLVRDPVSVNRKGPLHFEMFVYILYHSLVPIVSTHMYARIVQFELFLKLCSVQFEHYPHICLMCFVVCPELQLAHVLFEYGLNLVGDLIGSTPASNLTCTQTCIQYILRRVLNCIQGIQRLNATCIQFLSKCIWI